MICARKSDQKVAREKVNLSQGEERGILKVQPGWKEGRMKGKNR